jgi:DNA-binding winged helix-turn-helix (wHTH) protein
VTQHVSVLRKMLADAGEDDRSLIETFPKRGYRFTVTAADDAGNRSASSMTVRVPARARESDDDARR